MTTLAQYDFGVKKEQDLLSVETEYYIQEENARDDGRFRENK